MTTVISVENLSKQYHLGTIGTGTLSHDLNRWWAHLRGKPDPTLKIGQSPVNSRQLTVVSEQIWALRDVSFEVKQGEVLGIIGRNGAGKSTLLKILSRVTAPTSGEVKVKGRIASLLEVGTGFHPELTGRENIYLNGAILGMDKGEIKRKFDEIVAFAEVEKFIDTPVKRYSSGMYVRLAFAVAAHLEPEILLVDEVLAVGDAAFQKKCLGKMGDVAKEGRTVLFVSHNMAAVESLCTHGILLESGQVKANGLVGNVTELYLAQTHLSVHGAIINLEDWKDRNGSGRAHIVRLEILDSLGDPVQQISFRDRLRFRLTCSFPEEMDATFGVLIHSLSEIPLLDLRSTNGGVQATNLFGQVVIEGEIDALNLYPGDYYVSPWISDRMTREDIDFVHYCAKLSVLPAVHERALLKLDPVWGKFVVESRWRLVN